jgi:hypothetical protein
VPVEPVNTFLSWTPSGKSIVIRLDHDVVQRLNVDVMRGFGVTRRRGTETGGLLIGTIDRKSQPVVLHIQDFEAVPCEYASGPSYVLSAADKQKFQTAVERWQPSLEREVYAVGYFRSHTREGFSPDTADSELFREFFRDPLDVALLIKPFATRAATAGFFLQEKGVLVTDRCQVEFSFSDAGKQRDQKAPEDSQPDATRKPAPVAVPPVSASAPAFSSQPRPATPPKPPGTRSPIPSPVTTPRERPMFTPQESSPWGRRLAWTAFGIALLTFGGACGFEYGNAQARKAFIPSAAAGTAGNAATRLDLYAVHLRVSQTDTSVMVKWDRDAIPIQAALYGALTVTEGENSKQVKLGFAELRNGTALYPHQGPEIRFRLELFFADNRSFIETAEFRLAATQP